MRTHHILGVIAASICTIVAAVGPATASTGSVPSAQDAGTTSCAGTHPETDKLSKNGGGGFTSKYGYLASIESNVVFSHDGCTTTVLHEDFQSRTTGTGELYEYQKIDSHDSVEIIPSTQDDSQWVRVTQSATYHSNYMNKTFTTDFVYTLHADGTYDLTHQGNMPS